MIEIFKHAINKNAWLFLAAAWLYTLSFIFTNYFSYSASANKVAKTISEYIKGEERSFNNIVRDSAAVSAIVVDAPTRTKEELITDAQGIFVYQINDIGNPIEVFWNTNKMSIDGNDLFNFDGSYIVTYQNGTFEYIKKTIKYNKITYLLCTLIPVQWHYFLQNQYLKTSFALHEEISNTYEIVPGGKGAPVKNLNNKTVFAIREKPESVADTPGLFSILLRLTALSFLFVFISNIAAEIVRKKSFIQGFNFLIALFLLLRIIIVFVPFPFNYRSLLLFSTSVYNGNFLNRTLGDLLFNSILVMWIVIFFRRYYRHRPSLPAKATIKLIKVSRYSYFFIIPLFTFFIADTISSLVTHSSISFNAADFFSLSVYSFTGFAIICILLYVWIYVISVLQKSLVVLRLPLYWHPILFLGCCFLLTTIGIFELQPEVLLTTSAFLLFILFFIEFRNNPSLSSLVSSNYFIAWALILTAAASALITYQNNIAEKKDRIQIAENMQQETDSSGIYLLKMELSNFSDDFLQHNFYRFEQHASNKFLRDSLSNQNIAAFTNKYITKVYFFDKKNRPLYNEDSTNFDIINSVLENKGSETSLKNLFSYTNSDGNFNYIYKQSVDDSNFLGTIFILIQPKALKTNVLVPELFKQVNDITSQLDRGYTFGIYDNLKLISTFTGFNFADSVAQSQLPKTKYYYKDSLGFSQLWYKAGTNKLIIVAKRNNWLFNFITLFAYLFVLFIVVAFVVHESRRMLQDEPAEKFTFRNLFRFNIRTQIQTTIIGVSILSFLIIGIATISFFILRFEKATNAELLKTSLIISNEIQPVLNADIMPLSNNLLNNDDVNDFQKRISEIASIHNADLNFYSRNGNLIVSSQPYIYNKQILSNKINPVAFNEMHYRHSTRFTHDENIGTYSFQSVYVPIKDENDETIAYLNIPSLSSESELKEEISDFLVTLIILNAIIFIFAGAIAVALTGRITSSLELISNKMKLIQIGAINEEIEWKRKDEIGMLITEYNKMVHTLGESANKLARSERESAWREMAKQVAHEIKNPLTPMKLSIQYLQRSIENNSPHTLELSKKVAATLIEQIDQLSNIAGDFSQFANIESIKPEKFNLNEVIGSLVNLYTTDTSVQINWKYEAQNYFIVSDKVQINRLFTNLIKNAIEASVQNKVSQITISQHALNQNVIISIHDNGQGIDEALQSKIFNPNFTTKSSGTGLGLAICKAIVEKANGKIWFITAPGEGTIFYVELPLIE